MITCAADEAFDWIRQGRAEVDLSLPREQWQCRVRNLMPQFERYAKILHVLEGNYEQIDNPLSEREAQIIGLPACDEMKKFVQMLRKASLASRIRWKQIADWLNMPYEPEICHEWFVTRLKPTPQCWPTYIWGPAEGNLDLEERRELISILERFAPTQDCFYRFAEIPFIGTDKSLLFTGSLGDLESFLKQGKYQFSPEYWWAGNHSWCVCSDYDLTFTIVGGPAALVEALLASDRLEVLEVKADSRVDSLVPLPA